MRIAFLFDDAFGGRGGIAQFNRDFIDACCASSRCNELLLFQRIGPQDAPPPPPAKARYATQPRIFRYGPDVSLRYVLGVLRHITVDRRIDLIVCGHLYLLPVAYALLPVTGARLVTVMHGVEAWTPSSHHLANRLARRAKQFISVSQHTFNRFRDWTGNRDAVGHILWNTVDLERYGKRHDATMLRQRLGLENRRVVFTLGRLSSEERYKGYDEILNILPRLKKEFPDLTYVLGGDGDDRSRLESKADSLGVSNSVMFTGYISEEEKPLYYAMAEVFLLAGRGEGFGIVLLEALASGCRVIASRLDASAEAIGNGRLGAVVDPGNSDELANAISSALHAGRRDAPQDLEAVYGQGRFRHQVHDILTRLAAAPGTMSGA
jgi:glycosyltransferase involved in cell wall biosynthesis